MHTCTLVYLTKGLRFDWNAQISGESFELNDSEELQKRPHGCENRTVTFLRDLVPKAKV